MNIRNSKSTSWRCKGTSDKPHPEVENFGDQCDFPGCNERFDSTKKQQIIIKKQIIFAIYFVVAVAVLGLLIRLVISIGQKPVESENNSQQLKEINLEPTFYTSNVLQDIFQ
ncbi:MAG: hypothetical protein F6K16_16395 [Symploca sp. SIO2B6]|nr:hypothetical protein [Symploca sp. SIO2B6]